MVLDIIQSLDLACGFAWQHGPQPCKIHGYFLVNTFTEPYD